MVASVAAIGAGLSLSVVLDPYTVLPDVLLAVLWGVLDTASTAATAAASAWGLGLPLALSVCENEAFVGLLIADVREIPNL